VRTVPRWVFTCKFILIFLIIGITALAPTMYYILQRPHGEPDPQLHDGAFQTEIALHYLLTGRNPYAESYVGTGLESYVLTDAPENPALYNFVYFPALLLLSLPFYAVSSVMLGWYDQRIVYLVATLLILFLLPHLTSKPDKKLLLLILVGLNFYTVEFLRTGRNDLVTLLFLLLTVLFLRMRKQNVAAFCLGVACATKPSAWFFIPFLSIFLTGSVGWRENASLWLKKMIPFWLVLMGMTLPFLLWDAGAFFTSTVAYVLGLGGTVPYPIRGYGFSTLLLWLGVIPSPLATFPFVAIQLVTSVPVLIGALRAQRRNNTMSQALFGGAMVFLVFMFFSRFFQNNYFQFALIVVILAWLMDSFEPMLDISQRHMEQSQ